MPIAYQINHDKRLVVATPQGVLTEADVFGYQREVWSRPDTQGYDELIDMTDVTEIESVSAELVASLADLSGKMDAPSSASKLAIIAMTDLHFGLARMYQVRREMATRGLKEVRVFRSRGEAWQWLGAGNNPPPAVP